ncbi:MAG: APC family permease [Vicinamibacterales bacterium]
MASPRHDRKAGGLGLLRVVGHWDLTAQGINIVLASSVFVLPGIMLASLGGWAPLAVVGAAVGVLFVLLSFGEAAGRYSEPGGPYRYAGDAFGEYVGAQVGLLYWVVRATASASVAHVFVMYAAELWAPASQPIPRTILLSAVVLGAGWLNYLGTRQTASVLNVVTIFKTVPLLILCVVSAASLSTERFGGAAWPSDTSWARAVLLWVYAFGGFEATVIPASEARNPRHDVPRALLFALAIVAVFYVAVQVVVIGVLPGEPGERPVAEVARLVLGGGGVLMIALAAMIATTGHIPGSILASSRITFAMAERGGLPRFFARVHPVYRTPYVSVIVFTIFVWLLAVSGTFIWNASISAVGRLLVYVATALAVLKLRRTSPSEFAPPAWVHAATTAFCVWLFMYQTLQEAIVVGIVIGSGSLVWVAYRWHRRSSRPTWMPAAPRP